LASSSEKMEKREGVLWGIGKGPTEMYFLFDLTDDGLGGGSCVGWSSVLEKGKKCLEDLGGHHLNQSLYRGEKRGTCV